MASVEIVGGTEETRLLLRGLLRLYRHEVVGEGPTFGSLPAPRPGDAPASVAIVDLDLGDAETVAQITRAKRDHPGLRVLLLTPNRTAIASARAEEAGIDALLRRPFAVHELMDALELPAPPRRA